MSAQPNKPIKAKLGEASSFVYDPELKRWINKKAGAENIPTPSATPPPPRASGPPRTASGPPSSGPTSAPRAPPQRAVSESVVPSGEAERPSSTPPMAVPGAPPMLRQQSTGSLGAPPPSGPPSRPGTSMSNASSIDDLLGPPSTGVRRAKGAAKKKGRGYVDVMGEKAAGAA
jgi:hypothetical protein